MELATTPLRRLTFLVIWLLFTSCAFVAESQNPPDVASPRPPPPALPATRQPPRMSYPPPPPRRHPHKGRPQHHPPPPPPPPPAKKMNLGKKVGLVFAGIAGVLQIGVVAFLVFQRRRLLSMRDRYENCSS